MWVLRALCVCTLDRVKRHCEKQARERERIPICLAAAAARRATQVSPRPWAAGGSDGEREREDQAEVAAGGSEFESPTSVLL